MPSAGFSAKNARVQFGGLTNIAATKWMVNVKVDELDITNFETTGDGVAAATNLYADYTSGIIEAEFSVELVYAAANPPDTIPHIVPGAYGSLNSATDPNQDVGAGLGILRLYLHRSTTLFWHFPNYVILTASNDAEVRGIVKYSFTGKAKGTFYSPGGGGVVPVLP